MNLVEKVENPMFLSHCKVVPGIRQLIELTNVLIVEKPLEYIEYHMIIADFLLLILERADKEPYLFDLFSSHAKGKGASSKNSSLTCEEETSMTFLPFKIGLYLLQMVNPVDKSGLLAKVLNILRL